MSAIRGATKDWDGAGTEHRQTLLTGSTANGKNVFGINSRQQGEAKPDFSKKYSDVNNLKALETSKPQIDFSGMVPRGGIEPPTL
jgi:hypothetical protein